MSSSPTADRSPVFDLTERQMTGRESLPSDPVSNMTTKRLGRNHVRVGDCQHGVEVQSRIRVSRPSCYLAPDPQALQAAVEASESLMSREAYATGLAIAWMSLGVIRMTTTASLESIRATTSQIEAAVGTRFWLRAMITWKTQTQSRKGSRIVKTFHC